MLTCPPILFFQQILILDFLKPKKQQKLSNKEKLSSSFYTQIKVYVKKIQVDFLFFLIEIYLFYRNENEFDIEYYLDQDCERWQ